MVDLAKWSETFCYSNTNSTACCFNGLKWMHEMNTKIIRYIHLCQYLYIHIFIIWLQVFNQQLNHFFDCLKIRLCYPKVNNFDPSNVCFHICTMQQTCQFIDFLIVCSSLFKFSGKWSNYTYISSRKVLFYVIFWWNKADSLSNDLKISEKIGFLQ